MDTKISRSFYSAIRRKANSPQGAAMAFKAGHAHADPKGGITPRPKRGIKAERPGAAF